MRLVLILVSLLLLTSCASVGHTLKYGFLPGGDYQYYSPLSPVDLQGKSYKLVITDDRKGTTIQCTNMTLPRDTELEGTTGFTFFSNYMRAMILANNGLVDQNAKKTINVQLSGLSGELRAIVYGHVYGLVQFDITIGDFNKTYCSSMADGDKDAPVG
ncbi:MAG: hypothetical protein GY729_01875, partial [Desulfobacteraceae bacterium]|nr:hypothetical protein [Desulfobacteraceae bacterium]